MRRGRESPASAAAWNSEFSMVALAVRVRTSSGFSSTSLLKPFASRVTFSVSLSDSLRSSPTSSPPRCMNRSSSPGFSRSTWLRSSGRLRSVARSPRFSSKRRNSRSIVSLRLTTTSIVEKPRLASCGCRRRRPRGRQAPRPELRRDSAGGSASRGNAASAPTIGDQPDLEQVGGPGREPRNGGLDEDRHDLYNVTHGSIKGQSTRSQNVIALSNPSRSPNNNPMRLKRRMNGEMQNSDRGTACAEPRKCSSKASL